MVVPGITMKKIFRLNPITIVIMAIIIGISAYVAGVPFLDMMELKTIDLRFTARGPIDPSPYVTLAVVDEKSLSREGKWPWPRKKMADFITKLSDAGARVIAFDIVWAEPDDPRSVETVDAMQNQVKALKIQDPSFNQYLIELKSQTDHDQLLADAVKNSDAKVVLGYFLQTDLESAAHIGEEELPIHQENILSSRYQYIRYTSAEAMNLPFQLAVAPQSNISVISKAAEYSGTFNMIPDSDGVVRRMPAVFKFNDTPYAPISLMAVSAFLDSPPSVRVADYGLEMLQIGELSIPTDELGRIMVNYRGGEQTFPYISVTDILHDDFPKDTFQGKIVMVGVTATGIYDVRVTPFDSVYPGLEIHATIVDSILTEDFLEQPSWAAIFDILAILLSALLLGFALPRIGVAFGATAGVILFGGYIWFCQYVFSNQGWILSMVYPLAVMLLVYVGITAYKYLSESKQKKFIKGAFSTYLAPTVVKQLMDSPEKLALGGEERVITAFFSDIQGFTSISEKLTPSELVDLLQDFLAEMTDIILKYEGTVDKFEGDAIIAMFGAPIDMENHAEVAARASIDMQNRLVELREDWKAEGKPEMQMRIGLDTGPAVVGNMGSKSRMDYTMMGNTVNTAARLEGVNKVYGIYTLVGENTYEAAGDDIVSREIDAVNVVGKQEPVKVYQLLGYPADIDDRQREMVDYYHKGLYAYRSQDWDSAMESFHAALAVSPDDGPSRTMLTRCEEFKSDPPDEEWNGTYTMKSK